MNCHDKKKDVALPDLTDQQNITNTNTFSTTKNVRKDDFFGKI